MPTGLTAAQNENVRPFVVELNEQHGWSQQRIGTAIGLSQAQVSRVIEGKGGMSWPSVERLAGVLRLDPSAMLRGERVPLSSIRDLPEYTEARAALRVDDAYTEAILDTATRALDAVQCAEVNAPILEDAANFAQRHRPKARPESRPVGVTARLMGAVKESKRTARVEGTEATKTKKARGE